MAPTEDSGLVSQAEDIQQRLAPYIRSRQETSHIRKIISAHIYSQFDEKANSQISGPLALLESTVKEKRSSTTIRGIRREYLKCMRASVKARQDYELLVRRHEHFKSEKRSASQDQDVSKPEPKELEEYVLLIKLKQRLERLRILQDYLEKIVAESTDLPLQLDKVANTLESLPAGPTAILSEPTSDSVHFVISMDILVHKLERRVLEAKAALRAEKKGASQAPVRNNHGGNSEVSRKLSALSHTRDELIHWMEEELSKAGEMDPLQEEKEETSQPEFSAEQQENLVKSQYARYISVRRQCIELLSSTVAPELKPEEGKGKTTDSAAPVEMACPTAVLLPYLNKLFTISNEQKSFIQQKSQITTTLAKEYKETMQTFDRLADESHLLSAYPQPQSRTRRDLGTATTFADEMSSHQQPNTSDRAKAWSFAAEQAAINTKSAVLENMETGSNAVEEARRKLASVSMLLGCDDLNGEQTNVWELIDGNIAFLGRDDMDGL